MEQCQERHAVLTKAVHSDIGNYKSQIPNAKQIPNPKIIISKIGIWVLFVIWCLVLEI